MDTSLFAKLSNESGYQNTQKHEVLNPYINFMKHKNTQQLADVLVQETIQMRGLEFYFIPREFVDIDQVFGEDLQNKFTKSWKVAMYLESFDAYSGNNSFFSKFGLEANDEINLIYNPALFKNQTNDQTPIAGDLIYFPMDNSLFEISWVEPYTPFYQVGQNSQKRITAQKFIYSGEKISPELQRVDHIDIPEFADLELEPVKNLNNLHDNNTEQYVEVDQINTEAKKWVKPYYSPSGKGSPFSDFGEGE